MKVEKLTQQLQDMAEGPVVAGTFRREQEVESERAEEEEEKERALEGKSFLKDEKKRQR